MLALYEIINYAFVTSIIPGIFYMLWLFGVITLNTFKLCLFGVFVVFVILPLLFKYSITIQRNLLFLTFVNLPKNVSLEEPQQSGLHGSRNFKVQYFDKEENSEVTLGAWHILPSQLVKTFGREMSLESDVVQNIPVNVTYELSTDLENAIKLNYPTVGDENETDFYEHLLAKSNNPVILYLHGNANARGATHRVELYKILRSLGCHIITFDYRFYGDSTKIEPTEAGVVADAMAMYKYVTSQTDRPIFIWGHSLGTGVATHLMSLLQEINGPRPRGVFLESPFNNIKDEVREHPFAVLFKHLPWFEYTITDPMNANKFVFASDQHIAEFKAPVAIMHAEDDVVVPFQLGYKLYRAGLDNRSRSWGPIEFHRFEKSFGHKFICRSPKLPGIIKNFINNYIHREY